MGRHQYKDPEDLRNRHVAFYVSERELGILNVKRGGMRLSDWLRHIALTYGSKIVHKKSVGGMRGTHVPPRSVSKVEKTGRTVVTKP